MNLQLNRRAALGLAMPALLLSRRAWAEDTLKLAVGQRGNWETSIAELGQEGGFFRKRGLALDILYTEGGGQSQQAVIAGGVEIGVGVGTYGVLGAFARGAPVRVIGNATVGAHDLYWYVRADSPIRTMREAAGKTVAYSVAGSSTNLVVIGLQKTLGVQFRPTATGSPPATFTQVMSGQIDVGWAAPPFGVDAVERGETRIVARGSDVPAFADQTVRLVIANAAALQRRPEVFARFMQAYRESLDWMYADPAALAFYSTWAHIPLATATRARDAFYPKANLDPDRVIGIDAVMADAVEYRLLPAPLRPDQLNTLIQVPAPIR